MTDVIQHATGDEASAVEVGECLLSCMRALRALRLHASL